MLERLLVTSRGMLELANTETNISLLLRISAGLKISPSEIICSLDNIDPKRVLSGSM